MSEHGLSEHGLSERGPWGWLDPAYDGPLVAIGCGLVLLVGLALASAGHAMRRGECTRGGRAGIVQFELAWSAARARAIVARWGEAGVAAARRSLWWDYGWLVAYGGTLSLACAALGHRAGEGSDGVLAVLAWVALAAALLDAVENTALLAVLRARGAGGELAPRLAAVAASVKFVFVALVLAGVLAGAVAAVAG